MSSVKTKYQSPQWRLVITIGISLITLLSVMVLMHNPAISAAAPNGVETSPLQVMESNQSATAPHTILVGVTSEMAVGMANEITQGNEPMKFTIFPPNAIRAEPLLSFAETAVSSTVTNSSSRLGQIYKLQLEPDADMAATIRQLEANPDVLFAEPDYLAHLITTPNDPLFNGQWGLTKINAPTAWDVTTGSSTVVIAVIDSGLDTTHPDLVGQMWTNPGEIANNGIDDDNNGHIDDIHGWNMVDDNDNLSDNTGHGTEVAGVIGAVSDNGQGVAGVCWNCRLMVLKVTQSGGIANYSDIIEAIQYATLKGADVINLSLGGSSDSVSLRIAVENAAATAVVVGGAGNNNNNTPFYPAAYESVLAVAGTSNTDTKVGSSNYGSWVDVGAPGEAITTTFDGGSYGLTSGTSMAAPFASGLAGLLRSAHPDWSADTARAQIIQTATAIDSVNPGYEGLLGSGRIDAAQALTTAAQPEMYYMSHTVDGTVNGRPEPGSTFDLNVSLSNDWADAANIQATLSSADSYVTIVDNAASYGSIDTFNKATNLTPFRVTVSNAAPYAHDLVFNLNVMADGGYVASIPFVVQTAGGVETISGAITTDTTWNSSKIYHVTGNLLIPSGISLTIQAGTKVQFASNMVLRVDGTLIAIGSEEAPIIFTADVDNSSRGYWQGIQFDSSQDAVVVDSNYVGGSSLQHAIVEYAVNGVFTNNSSPYLGWNEFRYNSQYGIFAGDTAVGDSHAVITRNYFHHNQSGLWTSGGITTTYNLISDNDWTGMLVDCAVGAPIAYNAIYRNKYAGIELCASDFYTLTHNTISENEDGVIIRTGNDGASHFFENNNLVNNLTYDLRNETQNSFSIANNWWGTENTSDITGKIYDFSDDFNLGAITFAPVLASPDTDAPAYVQNIDISPASPIGIETATFNLKFSRPMDQSVNPDVQLHWDQSGSKLTYTSANSDILGDYVTTLAIDSDDNKWFADLAGVSHLKQDGTWTTYTPSNSGLASTSIGAAAVDNLDNKWFGSSSGYGNDAVVSKLSKNGVWTTYNNTGLTDSISRIVPDSAGNVWFASTENAAKLNNNGTWTMYSFYPDYVRDIAIDQQNNVWFAFDQKGVKVLSPTGIWSSYTTLNSGLDSDKVFSIAIDEDDNKWIGTDIGLNLLMPDGSWTKYLSINDGVIRVRSINFDSKGNVWFFGEYAGMGGSGYHLGKITPGNPVKVNDWSWNYAHLTNWVTDLEIDSANNVWLSTTNGASVVLREVDFSISDSHGTWINDATWQADFDINALVPRGVYSVTVTNARGTDGMIIPTDSRFSFTVDYAGEITDQTPPNSPFALAGGLASDTSGFEALWFANDADSSITGYRYALGSAPGTTDIINWTTTNKTSVRLSGLGLTAGQRYWLAVQARNSGGLWSTSTYSGFVTGQPLSRIFLPALMKP